MEKLKLTLFFMISYMFATCQGKENVLKLNVYVQDILSGPNATVYTVAEAPITSASPTSFGRSTSSTTSSRRIRTSTRRCSAARRGSPPPPICGFGPLP
ncbi:hypothetical protein OROMI_018981 [Orobanche minor]